MQFLAFFKLAAKITAVMAFFALTVLLPINNSYVGPIDLDPKKPDEGDDEAWLWGGDWGGDGDRSTAPKNRYLWAYLAFAYFFSILTIYLMNLETFRVLRIRQDYLGGQFTITDRTFRLSGIPKGLKSEDKIKQLVERLEIGTVENVTLCRDWSELDRMMAERDVLIRRLEELWSVYLGQKPALPRPAGRSWRQPRRSQPPASVENGAESTPQNENDVDERGPLLDDGAPPPPTLERTRPQMTIRYGFLKLRSRKTDAIDYYEEKLRRLDDKIVAARKKEYKPADLAFVTMDSIAACQMAIQARIDPRPGQLLTKPAPAPSDVVWANTYAPRGVRRLRSWAVTIFVSFLSLVWLFPIASLAGLLNICTIAKLAPDLAASLERHAITKALVQTGLPTLTISLLNIAVPYLYDYLSYRQGMVSRGDVELSIISKNFFFTFFNIFLVYAVAGTVAQFWATLQEALTDARALALALARQIEAVGYFFTNFIILQGLGLFPTRLLELGSVSLYPVSRMGAKTPRDFAEIAEPPVFSYGFYLPTALLIFIVCLEYSITRFGYLVEFFGLLYFIVGYFTYKYQLLYAMDQPQHATGAAWRIICYRVLLGVFVFQFTMSGIMALNQAFIQSVLIIPLALGTIWYSYYFRRRFEPLTKYIALRSIRTSDSDVDVVVEDIEQEEDESGEERSSQGGRLSRGMVRRGSTLDEDKERGLKFVNPSLVLP